MKELTLIALVAVLAGGSGFLIKVPTSPIMPSQDTLGSRGWVHMQKLILQLFENICETSTDPTIIQLAQDFILDSGDYTDPNAVTHLKNLQYGGNLLPKGEIFSEYDTDHWNEVKAIYAVMYHAKDFDTFYKAAAWARQNVNCGLFVDTIYLAILNRRDTSKLSIPAPYELLPNYFIRKDIIVKASSLLADEDFTLVEGVREEGNAYVLDANYTADINNNEDESKLAYFREDIGLNSYYFLRKLKLASWLNTPLDTNNKYGEYLYQMMKQLTARYDLERYANGLPALESISWDSAIQAYDPMLVYSNEYEFIHRMHDIELADNHGIEVIQNIENNIVTVVSHMRQTGYNKTQIINHLMEIFVTSPRSYESLARQLLSTDTEITNGQLSVLYHLMTSQRDPLFWKLNKRIVEVVDNALKIMPKYSRNELYFPGVEIINVETKKLITLFNNFKFDVTDSLKSNKRETLFQVKISQPRLSHKPFIIKLNISSLVIDQKGLVKIYLGPKMVPGELAAKKNSFVLLDSFEINFKRGTNIVSRSSVEMKSFSNDFESLRALRKQVEDATFGFDTFPLNTIDSQIGYPSRLILPKGSPDGLPLEMFVFIAPFSKASFDASLSLFNTEFNTAILSPGFPLDLLVENNQLFNIPNAFIKDIVVTHKDDNKNDRAGSDKKFTGGKSFDPSSRPDYSAKRGGYKKDEEGEGKEEVHILSDNNNGLLRLRPDFTKRKEPVDNSSKRGQYGKFNEYGNRKDTIGNNSNEATDVVTSYDNYYVHPEATYKKREPYDYSAKKEKYENKNYTKKYEKDLKKDLNQDEAIATSTPMVDLSKIKLENDVVENDNNLPEKYSITSNEIDDSLNLSNDYVTKIDNTLLRADSIEEVPKKRWTIFDYLIPPVFDSSEDKVYE